MFSAFLRNLLRRVAADLEIHFSSSRPYLLGQHNNIIVLGTVSSQLHSVTAMGRPSFSDQSVCESVCRRKRAISDRP